jgi:hypothetical protein
MARFFFDVINGTGLVQDEEGQDLPGLPAARDVAIEGARSIIQDDISMGFIDLAGRIEVRDEDRRRLLSISFRDVVELRGLDDGRAS